LSLFVCRDSNLFDESIGFEASASVGREMGVEGRRVKWK
jgi:hypothetical protein